MKKFDEENWLAKKLGLGKKIKPGDDFSTNNGEKLEVPKKDKVIYPDIPEPKGETLREGVDRMRAERESRELLQALQKLDLRLASVEKMIQPKVTVFNEIACPGSVYDDKHV